MKKKQCSLEARILAELVQKQPGKEVKDHIKKCPVCRDLVMVRSWMKRFGKGINKDPGIKSGIPDFESLWMKSKTSPAINPELEKRALLPLMIPRILLYVMIVLGILFLFTAKSESIKTFLYNDLKLGVLYNIFMLMGKRMLSLLPYMMIPLGFILFFMVGYFLYSLFHPRKA